MKRFTNLIIVSGFLITISIFALLFTPGCAKKSEQIKIGVVGPFTGEGATYGDSMRRGFELAFQNEPAIKLIYEDDKFIPQEGVTCITKLISADKVQVVLGSAASSVTLAMAPIAEKNKVILISSISTSDDLRKSGEYIFRNVPRNEIQGTTAARYLFATLGKKNVAILKKNDDYAINLAKGFQTEFQKLGGTILLDEAYEKDTRDFRGIVTKIKASDPQAVYIPGNYQEVALFLKQAYEGGLKTPFVGGDGSYSPELIKLAGNAAEGTCYTIMAVKHNDYYKQFNEAFKKKYQRDPDVYDAYAYEAASIILKAIKDVGYDATKIKDYLLSHSFESSLTGPLKFDQDGEVDRQYGIVKVQNGKFVDVE